MRNLMKNQRVPFWNILPETGKAMCKKCTSRDKDKVVALILNLIAKK